MKNQASINSKNVYEGLDQILTDYLDSKDLLQEEIDILNQYIQAGETSIHYELLDHGVEGMDIELAISEKLLVRKKNGFIALSKRAKRIVSTIAFLIIQHRIQREKTRV